MSYGVEDVVNAANSLSQEKQVKARKMVGFLAGEKLSECADLGVDFMQVFAWKLKPKEDDNARIKTLELLLNILSILKSEEEKEEYLYSIKVAKQIIKGKSRLVSQDELFGDYIEVLLGGYENAIIGSNGERVKSPEDDEEEVGEEEIGEEEEVYEGEPEQYEEDNKISDQDILRVFETEITSSKSKLLDRYKALFESGYDLRRPYGLLTKDGIIFVKNDELNHRDKVGTDLSYGSSLKIFNYLTNLMGITETSERSKKDLPLRIYSGYKSGSKVLYYFPNKLLEFAYGRKPSSGNGSQLRYYTAEGGNDWSVYVSSISDYIEGLFVKTIKYYVITENVVDIKDAKVISEVERYLNYTLDCLSACILIVDYSANKGKPVKLKVRVCDPKNNIHGTDLTRKLIEIGFAGADGGAQGQTIGSGLNTKVTDGLFVYEYAHDFNFSLSNAMPLFAYKASGALLDRGMKLSWNNLVIGESDKGTILKNGGDLSLSGALFHFVNAGSRAGKGVMTLNLLAGGIASKKVLFYLDNKPDMASLLSYLSHGNNKSQIGNFNGPEAFVVNGSNYEDDKYGEFTRRDAWVNPNNIPLAARELWGENLSWDNYGDIFYLRALTLVFGIMFARGRQEKGKREDPVFGGKNGLLIVVDEINKMQRGFISKITAIADSIPPVDTVYESLLSELEYNFEGFNKEKATKADKTAYLKTRMKFSNGFNLKKFYALSYLNSLSDSLNYIDGKNLAGFAEKEVGYSDVIIIGQDLEDAPIDPKDMKSATTSARLKNDMNSGLGKSEIAMDIKMNRSIPFGYFAFRYSDAFIGYNSGNPSYLDQGNINSKANSRLNMTANKFCYLPTFKVSKDGTKPSKQIESIAVANNPSSIYFKPYLILNSDDETYTSQMFKRIVDAGLSPEEVIAEYPDENNPKVLNSKVGFEKYINMLGLSDVSEVIKSGAVLANHVLENYIHYTGDPNSSLPLWLQFITDLRPEWMLSITDVAEIITTGQGNITKGKNNPILKEYYDYIEFINQHPEYEIVDPWLAESADLAPTDKSDFWGETDEIEEDLRLGNAMGDNDGVEDNEEIWGILDVENTSEKSVFADDDYNEGDTPIIGRKTSVYDSDLANYNQMGKSSENDNQSIQELISNNVEKILNGEDASYTANNFAFEVDEFGNVHQKFTKDSPTANIKEGVENLDFSDEQNAEAVIENYKQLMQAVTLNLVNTFGGYRSINSVMESGGAIAINGVLYKCKIDAKCKNIIPLDVRNQLYAGNISRLIDYSFLKYCPNISQLAFDSMPDVDNYVAPSLGFDVDYNASTFFKMFSGLQTLILGNEKYDRAHYTEQIKTSSRYSPSTANVYANACHSKLKDWNNGLWGFTKSFAVNKEIHWLPRMFGTIALAGASAVTGVARGASSAAEKVTEHTSVNRPRKTLGKTIRSGASRFFGGLSDLLDGE